MVPALAGALAARGYDTLTAVQTSVLAPEAEGADLLVSAQTGSGKTVAFGIAIAPTLLGGAERFDAPGAPRALIIAPTRELAVQVRRELEWLYRDAGARIGSCVGGMDMRQERRALEQGAHIVVGTPGRLRDHITRGSLDISELRAVVLDEADEMLDLGFREDLEFILAAAPADRRTLLFSATVPKSIALLAKRFQRNALRITASGESDQHDDIEYRTILVAPSDRENAIINSLLYFDAQNTLVFCATREAVRHLTSRLANRGFSVVSLSGELSQAERTNALQAMRDGRARVCVATDVAARGIDLPNLDLVIHADLPSNPETLLHRSGRTGRAGRKGICALIVPYHRRGSAARLLKLAKLDAASQPAPGPAEIDKKNRERIMADPSLTEAPGEDEADFVRELLAAYSPEQIAAAFLRQQLAARPAAEELSEGAAAGFRRIEGRTARHALRKRRLVHGLGRQKTPRRAALAAAADLQGRQCHQARDRLDPHSRLGIALRDRRRQGGRLRRSRKARHRREGRRHPACRRRRQGGEAGRRLGKEAAPQGAFEPCAEARPRQLAERPPPREVQTEKIQTEEAPGK